MEISTERLILRDFIETDYPFYYALETHPHIDNRLSERVMIKLNMTKEGILRQSRKLHNEWVDMLIYSYLDSNLNK